MPGSCDPLWSFFHQMGLDANVFSLDFSCFVVVLFPLIYRSMFHLMVGVSASSCVFFLSEMTRVWKLLGVSDYISLEF